MATRGWGAAQRDACALAAPMRGAVSWRLRKRELTPRNLESTRLRGGRLVRSIGEYGGTETGTTIKRD